MDKLLPDFVKNPCIKTLDKIFKLGVKPNELLPGYHDLSLLHVRQPYETMKYLLDKGGNPNLINGLGLAPIHFQKEFKTIKLLVSRGAIPNPRDIYDFTPLYWQKDPEATEYLLKYNPIRNNYIFNIADFDRTHPYMIMLIEGGYDPYSEKNISITPVFLQRDLKSLEILLDYCFINSINNYDIAYETLLFKPCINPKIIDLFDENNDNMSHQNVLGNTPLHVQHDPQNIVKLLRCGANPNIRNLEGYTPIGYHYKKNNILAGLIIIKYTAADVIIKNWRIYWFRKTYIPPKYYKKKLEFLEDLKLLSPSECGTFPGGIDYQNALEDFNKYANLQPISV